MKTILLETNAINQCVDQSLSGSDLKEKLSKKNITAIVNLHTLYELARIFLNPKMIERGKQLFTVIKELDPTFTCLTGELLRKEIIKLRGGENVVPICSSQLLQFAKEDINNLSAGIIVDQHRQFIESREAAIRYDQSIWDKLREPEGERLPREITYTSFVENYLNPSNADQIANHIKQHIGDELNTSEILSLINSQSSYPALRTVIRCDLYLNYIVLKEGNRPAIDKTDDLRHLIDSSYCTELVTDDAKLTREAKEICPELTIIRFDELLD